MPERCWSGCVLATLTGVLLILIFPQTDFSVLAWFALTPLLIALERKTLRESFFLGFSAGIVFYTGTLYWLSIFHPFALPLVVIFQSLYLGAFGLFYSLIKRKKLVPEVVIAPVIWTALEYLRSCGILGNNWNILGYSQYRNLLFIQMVGLTGVLGTTFLIVSVNALLSSVYRYWRKRNTFPLRETIWVLLLVIGAAGYGWYSLSLPDMNRNVRVALLQTNLGADIDWYRDFDHVVEVYSCLIREVMVKEPDLIVLPESSVRESIVTSTIYDTDIGRELGELFSRANTYWLIGANRLEGEENYNSAYLVNPSGDWERYYDKIHLVPFGEFIPGEKFLPFLRSWAPEAGDLLAGRKFVVFNLPAKGEFGVLICFEASFGYLARQFVNLGAQLLVNITNDVWSGSETAHYQHAAMAVFRAVENRVFLVRAGNSGVSWVVNQYGRIEEEIGVDESGIITADVAFCEDKTFYTCYGDVFAWMICFLSVLFLVPKIGHRRSKS